MDDIKYIPLNDNENDWERKKAEILEWEEKYSKQIEDISLNDFESIKLILTYFMFFFHKKVKIINQVPESF